MTAALLASACWAGAVLVASIGGPLPPPRRGRHPRPPATAGPGRRWARGRRAALIATGTCAVLAAGGVLAAAAVVVAALTLPVAARRRPAARARARLAAAVPEVLDVLTVALSSGLTVRQALALPASWHPPPARAGIAAAAEALDRGASTADALTLLSQALGPEAAPAMTALRTHVRDGTPLRAVLQRLGDDARQRRRRRAEAAARRLPVRLAFPLVACHLSAFVLLTVVPIGAATLRSLTTP